MYDWCVPEHGSLDVLCGSFIGANCEVELTSERKNVPGPDILAYHTGRFRAQTQFLNAMPRLNVFDKMKKRNYETNYGEICGR